MSKPPMHLLLVEDLPIYASLVKQMVENETTHLDLAGGLEEGVQKALATPYDLVLLDLGLPDSQGLDTYTQFRSRCPAAPVVIFSGLDDEQVAMQAVRSGAQDYITKGAYLLQGEAGRSLINRAIAHAIERHRIQQELLAERNMLETRVEARVAELHQANQQLESVLSALNVANQHLRSLSASLVSAQEDERRRISLELHDHAGQFLTALKLSLDMLKAELPELPAALQKQITEAAGLTETVIDMLRALAHGLRPPSLDTVGLYQALADYCQRIASQTGIKINYQGSDISGLPEYIQVSLYRVVQEALTNVVKHAAATQVDVRLIVDAEQLTLAVQDNGRGFDPAAPVAGIGLLGIRDRMEAIGGSLSIQSQIGSGTLLTANVPMQEAE